MTRFGPRSARFTPDAIREIPPLSGVYQAVSILTNALRLRLEPVAARLPGQGDVPTDRPGVTVVANQTRRLFPRQPGGHEGSGEAHQA